VKAKDTVPIRNPKASMFWLWVVDHMARGMVDPAVFSFQATLQDTILQGAGCCLL
jgi:hypothetical protein